MRYKRYSYLKRKRDRIVKEFYKKHEIEGSRYYICGEGKINVPFCENDKRNITLYIEDSEINRVNLEKHLRSSKKIDNLIELKKESRILKEFQEECIKNKIVINLYRNSKLLK